MILLITTANNKSEILKNEIDEKLTALKGCDNNFDKIQTDYEKYSTF